MRGRYIPRAVEFYRKVLAAMVHYADPDFAAINVSGVELMLHADHAYDKHPWHGLLTRGERRGLGAELRVLGVDPDAGAHRPAGRDQGPRLARGDGGGPGRLPLGGR